MLMQATTTSTDSILDEATTSRLRGLAERVAGRPALPGAHSLVKPTAGAPTGVWEVVSDYALRLLGSGHNEDATRPLAGIKIRLGDRTHKVTYHRVHAAMTATVATAVEEHMDAAVRMAAIFDFQWPRVQAVEFVSYDPTGVAPVAEIIAGLAATGNTSAALDEAFEFIEAEMLERRAYRCERLLLALNGEQLPTELRLGVLTATRPWRKFLKARTAFLERTRERLLEKYEPVRVAKILGGLE